MVRGARVTCLGAMLALVACAPEAPCGGEGGAWPAGACIAVLRTDYLSSAITFADCDGVLLAPSWLDSGTRVGSLVTSLSGDATLVRPPAGLGWIDRYNVDVMTIAAPDGSLVQHDLRGAATGTSSNPHDAVWLDDRRALVTRYGGAPSPTGGTVNDDVILLTEGAITASLSPDARTTIDGLPVYARPDELVLLGDPPAVAVVTLGRASGIYETFAEGMLAVVRLEGTPHIESLSPLTGVVNCGAIDRDPLDATRAIVVCSGPLREPTEVRRAASSVLEIALEAGVVSVVATARVEAPLPVPTMGLLALGDGTALVVGTGSAGTSDVRDTLIHIDVRAEEAIPVHVGEEPFGLGAGTRLPDGRVLWPDAGASEILTFDASLVLRARVPVADCVALPPRQLMTLAR